MIGDVDVVGIGVTRELKNLLKHPRPVHLAALVAAAAAAAAAANVSLWVDLIKLLDSFARLVSKSEGMLVFCLCKLAIYLFTMSNAKYITTDECCSLLILVKREFMALRPFILYALEVFGSFITLRSSVSESINF